MSDEELLELFSLCCDTPDPSAPPPLRSTPFPPPLRSAAPPLLRRSSFDEEWCFSPLATASAAAEDLPLGLAFSLASLALSLASRLAAWSAPLEVGFEDDVGVLDDDEEALLPPPSVPLRLDATALEPDPDLCTPDPLSRPSPPVTPSFPPSLPPPSPIDRDLWLWR